MVVTEMLLEQEIIKFRNDRYVLNGMRYNIDYFTKSGLVKYEYLLDANTLFKILLSENSKALRNHTSYQFNDKCLVCGNNVEFVKWNIGYKKYCCSMCAHTVRSETRNQHTPEQKQETNRRRRETCIEKYGVDNPQKLPDINQKGVKKQIALYGGVFNIKKSKETKLARYDNESYNNTIKQQQTMEFKFGSNTTFKIPELRNDDKRRETNLKKYGVLHPLQNNEVCQKALNAKKLKYGNPNYVNPEKHRETLKKFSIDDWSNIHVKRLNTIKERYGDSGYINLEKRNQTNIERYGVANISQASLNTNTGYRWKEYKLPSGKIIKYQGYEDKLLDKLLECYDENDIITSRGEMPEFWYIGLDNKKHRYFPDVYIPKTNTIYEVKSEYTLNINLEVNKLKFESVIDSGYKFELIIF